MACPISYEYRRFLENYYTREQLNEFRREFDTFTHTLPHEYWNFVAYNYEEEQEEEARCLVGKAE